MPYTVHSEQDRGRMLKALGAPSIDDLFIQIPTELRRSPLRLPPGMGEQEMRAHTDALAAADRIPGPTTFLGAGCYRHFVPAAVRALVSRSEFATAYTPYQPEVSQGTLEHIFEFQTCMCELTGMDVANASLYDGPSALAEGAFMALRATRRERIAVSAGVHPEALHVLSTYASGPSIPVHQLPLSFDSGATQTPDLRGSPGSIAAVLVQQPNYLGIVEDLEALSQAAHARGALLVVSVNPSTLGVLESPGPLGADIVVGDAQVFGCPPSFGGPSVGFLACRKKHMRQIPGRLVSQTLDEDGRVSYTLTLQAREQHIRRAKATSNICSNQALAALAATIHLALLGPEGVRERGEVCLRRAHYLQRRLCALPGVQMLTGAPFFNEFALRLPFSAEDFAVAMREKGVDPGVPLSRLWRGVPGDRGAGAGGRGSGQSGAQVANHEGAAAVLAWPPTEDTLLVAVTELNTPEALDAYVDSATQVLSGGGRS